MFTTHYLLKQLYLIFTLVEIETKKLVNLKSYLYMKNMFQKKTFRIASDHWKILPYLLTGEHEIFQHSRYRENLPDWRKSFQIGNGAPINKQTFECW